MQHKNLLDHKIGILGGGQLGKMLAIEAANWHLPIYILDQDQQFPAVPYAPFFQAGDFKNFDDVVQFGKKVDILTIEIEQINVDALFYLENEGVKVYPKPSTVKVIQDKGLQKMFYQERDIPTAGFQLFVDRKEILEALKSNQITFPFVQKSRKDGYDGKGVVVVSNENDITNLLDCPSIIEERINIKTEISILVARSASGELIHYEPVEQHFNQEANLVSFLICPAELAKGTLSKMNEIASLIAIDLDLVGLLAIEFFLDTNNDIFVNEVAPRPHNSGHHTQNSCETSQFEQHLRAILDLPLGSTRQHSIGAMVNIVGETGFAGKTKYVGIEECMKIEGAHLHLYGKTETRPFRKMGHINIADKDRKKVLENIDKIKSTLRVIS
ncbi:MAG: 5-(carboxyamino)imidazole ribonucleotide synthase [Haliscomenobacter sp.]|nr:5-(carboxyamino)imidazole ribonucleotide synthase [Haliscomenobacter sp.]